MLQRKIPSAFPDRVAGFDDPSYDRADSQGALPSSSSARSIRAERPARRDGRRRRIRC
jgi:hypothetical protein